MINVSVPIPIVDPIEILLGIKDTYISVVAVPTEEK